MAEVAVVIRLASERRKEGLRVCCNCAGEFKQDVAQIGAGSFLACSTECLESLVEIMESSTTMPCMRADGWHGKRSRNNA